MVVRVWEQGYSQAPTHRAGGSPDNSSWPTGICASNNEELDLHVYASEYVGIGVLWESCESHPN